jgi:hypothetical protein
MFSDKYIAKLTPLIRCENDSAFVIERSFPQRNLQPISTVVSRWYNKREASKKKERKIRKLSKKYPP